MNERKICFISCVNDHELYREALYYINHLEVPQGYEIECISIENAKSMAQGYNKAMKLSDAKYKVYLHQDVYIINKFFIKDILNIFENNEKIGMLGVAGAKTVPTNAIWWESGEKCGKVYDTHTGQNNLLSFGEVKSDYETVKAIDGLIMITQYDIPWREDIFDGWHFYDLSQSMEFIRAGYDVAIPNQVNPWIIHDCGIVNVINGYEDYRKLFLEEYSKDIFPLVSILIPTYNRPAYFKQALESALNQTYKNIEIIVGDDSTNDETEQLIKESYLDKYDNIKYYHNEKNLGKFDNCIKLYEMARGKYINFLMDDDLFEEVKIEKMMNYFIYDKNEEISLVTSHRTVIDDKGNNKGIFGSTDKVFKENLIIDGLELGNSMITNNYNCIGEPTTVLFRKDKLAEPFGMFNGRRYGCIADQVSWLNILCRGKAVYINEVLSCSRIHDEQEKNNPDIKLRESADYLHMILNCRERGFLKEKGQYFEACNYALNLTEHVAKALSESEIAKSSEYIEVMQYYNKLKSEYEEYYTRSIEKHLSYRTEAERENIYHSYQYDYMNDLFINKNHASVDYADGSEKYIINVYNKIRNIDKESYNHSFKKYIIDWPSKYHLSIQRSNIFESIREIVENRENVLELGGGMGAVTQWLAENCKNVDVIEGSLERAKANRIRNKYNSNVHIFVDDLLSMNLPKSDYDLVTLIGVLEYIPFYSQEENPAEACKLLLRNIYDNLKEDGLLVIAIENKLGAKYFSGCVEDHNGKLFSGIHGYPEKSPVTFSRFEIKSILESAGFKGIQFYHCFPDYKMAKVVLKEDEKLYDLSIASIARELFIDRSHQREYLLCDPLLIDTLTKARLLHEFSNSFLIVCSKSETDKIKTKHLAVRFWNDDGVKECYHHRIEFIENKDKVYIERKPFSYGKEEVVNGNLLYKLNNEVMTEGETLSLEAYRCLLRNDDYLSLINLVYEVKEFINKEFSTNQFDEEGYALLSGEAIDCCLNNIVRSKDNKLVFIDRKWKYNDNVGEEYVIFRSLFGLFNEMHPYIKESSLSEFVIPIMMNFYPYYSDERFSINLEHERVFRNYIIYGSAIVKDFSVGIDNKSIQFKQALVKQLLHKLAGETEHGFS
ncbi:MAG TPA: glycosyltransferase [Clostridiaceae bacterium]|nr:glycosyltransferase [Clostridiaceae bacterium]